MMFELEADLNADPTNEFVMKGEKKGTGHEWTCKWCGRNFPGHKCKLTVTADAHWMLTLFSGGKPGVHLLQVALSSQP